MGIGILRFLFAISVVIAHTGPVFGFTLIGGKIAVQSFFIISGFYMAFILNEKYIGNNNYLLYLKNRLLRIYPLYFFVLFLTFIFSFLWIAQNLQSPIDAFAQDYTRLHWSTIYYLILQNIIILTQDIGSFFSLSESGILFFDPHSSSSFPFIYVHSLIPQSWTLGIEIAFYIVAPLFVKRKIRTLLVLILVSLLARFYVYSLGFHHEPWINKFAPFELVFFLFGILAYKYYATMRRVKISLNVFLVAFGSFLLFTIFYETLPKILTLPINLIQWVYFLILAMLIPYTFVLFKRSSVDRFLGELSYPIYISHIFIIYFIRNLQLSVDPNILRVAIIIVVVLFSFTLQISLLRFVEKYRKNPKRQQKTSRIKREVF